MFKAEHGLFLTDILLNLTVGRICVFRKIKPLASTFEEEFTTYTTVFLFLPWKWKPGV